MKHSIAVKFIAFLLCAVSLVAVVGSSAGIALTQSYGLYTNTLESKLNEQTERIANELAWYFTQQHAAETLGNCPRELLMDMYDSRYVHTLGDRYAVDVYLGDELVHSVNDNQRYNMRATEILMTPSYPVVSSQYSIDEYAGQYATVPVTQPEYSATEAPAYDTTEPRAEATAAASAYTAKAAEQTLLYSSAHYKDVWDDYGYSHQVVYNLDYYQGPEYRVLVYLAEGTSLSAEFGIMALLYTYRNHFIPMLLTSLLVLAVSAVYLCVSAGCTADGTIRPTGLNRLPLDLYLLIAGGGCGLLTVPVLMVLEAFNGYNDLANNLQLCLLIFTLCALGIALLMVSFCFAFAAQFKTKNGFWWRHSVTGWILRRIYRFMRWIGRGFRFIARGCRAVFKLLPVIWQWLLMAFVMVLMPVLFFFLTFPSHGIGELFWGLLCLTSVAADVVIVIYGGWCFGTLMKGAKAMAQGDLNHHIPTKYMLAVFRDFGDQLNRLADAAHIAAEKQLKSERMKTELITNVSHDIKTPLTSIINFVDLLKKPHTDAEGTEYLEVLDRQSQRLKKLIDDLMEMSKASTGNLSVELGQVDAAEAVNQALGEFSDKLDAAHLTPVFRYPDTPVTMVADGRLVWRVLSNLLSNAVKYALPDTRLYIDLMTLQGNAVIAIKNISRDQLNVNAEELMERFVRGDTSRNTEGSGLGLNIAKSLVELQKGQMHLMVDGDLFKVTLIFPLS